MHGASASWSRPTLTATAPSQRAGQPSSAPSGLSSDGDTLRDRAPVGYSSQLAPLPAAPPASLLQDWYVPMPVSGDPSAEPSRGPARAHGRGSYEKSASHAASGGAPAPSRSTAARGRRRGESRRQRLGAADATRELATLLESVEHEPYVPRVKTKRRSPTGAPFGSTQLSGAGMGDGHAQPKSSSATPQAPPARAGAEGRPGRRPPHRNAGEASSGVDKPVRDGGAVGDSNTASLQDPSPALTATVLVDDKPPAVFNIPRMYEELVSRSHAGESARAKELVEQIAGVDAPKFSLREETMRSLVRFYAKKVDDLEATHAKAAAELLADRAHALSDRDWYRERMHAAIKARVVLSAKMKPAVELLSHRLSAREFDQLVDEMRIREEGALSAVNLRLADFHVQHGLTERHGDVGDSSREAPSAPPAAADDEVLQLARLLLAPAERRGVPHVSPPRPPTTETRASRDQGAGDAGPEGTPRSPSARTGHSTSGTPATTASEESRLYDAVLESTDITGAANDVGVHATQGPLDS